MSERTGRNSAWADADDEAEGGPPWRVLTATEAQALRVAQPVLSPWWVVAAQAVIGLAVAVVAGIVSGTLAGVWSALFGAAAVVVPGALMARGMTSRFSRASPVVSAVSVLLWESIKILATVAMLVLAPMLVQPLNWPVLLASLAMCTSVYAFALLWGGRGARSENPK